jgi:plastocyanin
MSARLVMALTACAAAAAMVTPAGDAAPAAAGHAARMLVYAQEWSLWASRETVPRGPVIVQLWNRGQDAHDLHLRRLNRRGQMIGRAQTLGVTESGAHAQASWRLTAGRYELYCSLPSHRQRGMHTLVVVN